MKDKPCKRHRAHPEFISDCVGCDIESYNSDVSELKGDLAELKEQYRWRDVKEELPEENTEVLGRFDCREIIIVFLHSDGYYSKRPERYLYAKLTHWMPMLKFEVKG